MVDDKIASKISEIVDNYLHDDRILEMHKEINVNRKNIGENEIKPLVVNFFNENIKVGEFKKKNDGLNKKHSLWGFKGTAGAKFFNQLYNGEDDKERLEKEVRRFLLQPDDNTGAKLKINGFSNYVREVREKVELRQKKPAPKSTVFFLSYFWHIQAPDKYPIFYPKSRKALRNLGLFDETRRVDYGELYIEFLNIIKDISQILEAKKSRNFTFDEISSILYWYVDKMKEINVWKCPKESCDNQVINIKRTQNIIETGTWREIIIHILKHLKQSIIYFGPSTIEKFLKDDTEDLLAQEDKQLIEYDRKEGAEGAKARDFIWKNRMRSALAQIKIDGYIETYKSSDNYTFQAHFRSRKRTEKFFNDFEIYNDWSDIDIEGEKIVFCRTGWMKYYKGISDDDKIVRGGRYIEEYNYGNEILNFKPAQGYYYGFVQANSKTIDITRLGASRQQESIEGINVVWGATSESGGQMIYGWYRNATVFRKTQSPSDILNRSYNGNILYFNIRAKIEDCHFLPAEERDFQVPLAKEKRYGFGMSNVWYAEEEEAKEFRNKVLAYIDGYEKKTVPSISKTDFELHKKDFISFLLERESKATVSNHIKMVFEDILKLLNKRKQVILIGPPGTGKTYLARIIADKLTDGDVKRVNLIQFHPEYCYENFIECLQIKSGSNLELEQKAQIFRKICKDAFDSKLNLLHKNYLNEMVEFSKPEQIGFQNWYEKKINLNSEFFTNEAPKYVLIIDEINRGDLSRIFGEAIMALEYRNTPIKTMYFDEDEPLIIPDNLYIIGTMNSVDRSIAILDYALRRRFLFYDVKPNRDILEEWLEENKSEVKDEILKVFDRLNDQKNGWISNTWKDSPQLAINFQIGHSYFFQNNKEQFQVEWEYSIVPLLLEYMNFSNDLINSFKENFDVKDPFIIP